MKKESHEQKIAYVIPGPTEHLTLHVKHSANAWWMDAPKLHRLLRAFEAMSPVQEACEYAGITVRQYKYFAQEHPLIKEIRAYPNIEMSLRARQSLARGIQNDWKLAYKYLSRRDKLFGDKEQAANPSDPPPNPARFFETIDGKAVEIKSPPDRKKRSDHQ